HAGGSRGARAKPLPADREDASNYYPPSPRDAAPPARVPAREKPAGIDTRYRRAKGSAGSARVSTQTDRGAAVSPTQITLSVAGSDAVVARAVQMDAGPMNRGRMNRGASRGFAFYGVPDGEYEVVARRGGVGAESDAISAPRRVSVRGADV